MTSLKTVLLGSAAALVATGAAQAADLPVKKAAAAVQYVEVCPAYGSGFYKLPGTDICIRHFGTVKFNTGFQDRREFVDSSGVVRVERDAANVTGWQWTIRPGWDFRSPTEWGTLRTVVQLRVDMRAGIFEDNDSLGDSGVGPNLRGTQRVNNMVQRGYIEWAGFTIGKIGSNFIYWDQDDVISAIGGSPKESVSMAIAYTFSAPGWKAIISLEDPHQWAEGYNDRMYRTDGPGDSRVNSRGPFGVPDVILALTTEGPWGNAKVAGLLHPLQTVRNAFGDSDPVDFLWDRRDSSTGFAVLGGVTFMLPSLGSKDQLMLEATHCDGVGKACGGQGGGAADSPTAFERPGQYIEGLSRDDVDAYITPNADGSWTFHKTKWTSVAAQFRHYWAPLWRTNIMGSYMKITTPDVAKDLELRRGGRGDARVWDVGANLIWGQSRKTAEIGVEVLYKNLKQDLPNGMTQTDLNDRRGIPGSTDKDPSGWLVAGFIQRSW